MRLTDEGVIRRHGRAVRLFELRVASGGLDEHGLFSGHGTAQAVGHADENGVGHTCDDGARRVMQQGQRGTAAPTMAIRPFRLVSAMRQATGNFTVATPGAITSPDSWV